MKSARKININLDENIANVLDDIASKEHKAVSSIVKDLINDALERREDVFLSKIAQKRDVASKKKVNHGEAWN